MSAARRRMWLLGLIVCLGVGCSSAPVENSPRVAATPPAPEDVSEAEPEVVPEFEPDAEQDEAPQPAPPATDIFVVDFDVSSLPWKAVSVERVTDRDAYDNQPHFEPDGRGILFTAAHDEQTDIFRYILGGATEQLTETPESEYSPTPIPGWPGFSTVRVEADGTQRLWKFCDGTCTPELVFEDIQPVGYHAWIDPETVAMFVLGEPHELVVGDLLTGEGRVVATDIGRALHAVPGEEAVSFVDKSEGDDWVISLLDLADDQTQRIIHTPPGSEDFVWWSEGEILIGSGSKLYRFRFESDDAWHEVADLEDLGIDGITRLSVAPDGDRLAIVGERRK